MGYDKLKTGLAATAASLILGYGCGKPSPIQPASLTSSSNGRYETLDSRLNTTFPFQSSFFNFQENPITSGPKLNRNLSEMGIQPTLRNLHTATKIASAQVKIVGAENIGFDIARYRLVITAPGYETRETTILDDVKAPVLSLEENLIPVDPQVRILYDEAARTTHTGGTSRWKQPPVIYISKSNELTRGAAVTAALIKQVTDLVPKDFISQFGDYAENADVRVVDGAPWVKLDPNQPGKWPAKAPNGSMIIQFSNLIPGIGQAGIRDDNKDGYMDSGVVFLRTASFDLKPVIRQEVGTLFLFENFPKSLPDLSSVYVEGLQAETFTSIDTKAAHWGYNRPGLNLRDDKDNGWDLKFRKNEKGIFVPVEERLLLNGIVYKPILIPGDFTQDNKVDFDDFFAFAEVFGTNNPEYDLSKNGFVDFDDFFTFAENFGRARQTPMASKQTLDARVQEIAALPNPQARMDALLQRLEQEQNAKEKFRNFLTDRR